MPPTLESMGLNQALKSLCNNTFLPNGDTVFFIGESEIRRCDMNMEVAIFRISQELLNNAIKHSQAKSISLNIKEKEKNIILSVTDDGKGFDVSTLKPSEGLGFYSIKSRLQLYNGQLDIHSKENKGTKVLIQVPMAASSNL